MDVPGLTKVPVSKAADAGHIMAVANKRRSVASTSMNEHSSRSHSVFTLYIVGRNQDRGVELKGTLNLCDLAGSERLARSKAEGKQLKETQAINKSLSCMADVFQSLAQRSKHVPFRNSKLTYLLQPCLEGDGKTMMMVNLSPTVASSHESLCSLRFAQQVAQVQLGQARKRIAAIRPGASGSVGSSGSAPSSSSSSSSGAAAGGAAPVGRVKAKAGRTAGRGRSAMRQTIGGSGAGAGARARGGSSKARGGARGVGRSSVMVGGTSGRSRAGAGAGAGASRRGGRGASRSRVGGRS